MLEAGRRKRNQPAPPGVIFEALTEPNRDLGRQWLKLLDDEVQPEILESVRPSLVVWSSPWVKRPDARICFDLPPDASGYGTDLRWTLTVDAPMPGDELLGHVRKRVNELINRDLRLSFGQ
jgi:hypothetical protein